MIEANALAAALQAWGMTKDYPHEQGRDELFTPQGEIRPHWRSLAPLLFGNDPGRLAALREESSRLLRENGVSYNAYGDGRDFSRPWELDPIPLLFTRQEWQELETGITQRHLLFSQLLADLNGPCQVIKQGLLPADLFFDRGSILPQCQQTIARGMAPLPLYAADLGRDQKGRWHVLTDRTQSPSGIGYVLENRVALSRVLADYRRGNSVRMLRPFYQTLRENLSAFSPFSRMDLFTVLLTPGPWSETYFEHALLANYLGIALVTGDDLTVRGGRVFLKTLDGLHPVDVILRRVDDSYCDPLELRGDSLLGVVGLLHAARRGRVTLFNPLGSGVLENQAIHAFMPALARHFLGQDLLLPSLPTWWCGDEDHLSHVLGHLEEMVIKPVMAHGQEPSLYGGELDFQQLQALRQRILAQPRHYVAQPVLATATLPVLAGEGQQPRLEARHVVFRAFSTQGRDKCTVLPGGLVWVSASPSELMVSMRRGGLSKDVWVLADTPPAGDVQRAKLYKPLAPTPRVGELPSRAAENLFWLGRYAERAEETIRLLRVVLHLMMEASGSQAVERRQPVNILWQAFERITHLKVDGQEKDLESAVLAATVDSSLSGSVAFSLRAMIQSAQSVRDRLSPDTWRMQSEIAEGLERWWQTPPQQWQELVPDLNRFLNGLLAFAGLAMENTTHGQGWTFLDAGRRLERAMFMAGLLHNTLCCIAPLEGAGPNVSLVGENTLAEALLHIADCYITYHRRYRFQLEIPPVLELLLQDESNPRSLGFQLTRLEEHILRLPYRPRGSIHRTPHGRTLLEAQTLVRLARPEQLAILSERGERAALVELLQRVTTLLPQFSENLSNAYFRLARHRQLVSTGM